MITVIIIIVGFKLLSEDVPSKGTKEEVAMASPIGSTWVNVLPPDKSPALLYARPPSSDRPSQRQHTCA